MSKYTTDLIREITDVESVLASYREAQIWTGLVYESDDPMESGAPMDSVSDWETLGDGLEASMREDVTEFCKWVRRVLRQYAVRDGLDAGQLGHDFSLTRNHHGAGFWDRGYGALGDRLTDIAHSFGEASLYAWRDANGEWKAEQA